MSRLLFLLVIEIQYNYILHSNILFQIYASIILFVTIVACYLQWYRTVTSVKESISTIIIWSLLRFYLYRLILK